MSLNNLNELISVYLNTQKTDYAILINGEWGSGKTFYIKNELIPFIEKIELQNVHKDKGEKFKVSYISLYGLSNSQELNNKILLQLNPGLKKVVTIGSGILQSYIEQKSGLKIDKEIKELISLYNIPKNRVLIFDDLERLEIKILNEVLGFLNAYTEHENLKLIIIANETELSDKVNNNLLKYDKIKEKLIRFTYQFSHEIEEVFMHILINYQNDYRKYIIQNQALICNLFKQGKHRNLRTLKFILDILGIVFKVFEEEKSIKEEYRNEILDYFLFSLSVYAIEYKKEQNIQLLNTLENISAFAWNIILIKEAFPEESQSAKKIEDPIEAFKNEVAISYLQKNKIPFRYFHWLVSLIHTGVLDKSALIADARKIENELETKNIKPEYQKLRRLENVLIIENNNLSNVISEVINEVRSGSYQLNEYQQIFSTIEDISKNISPSISVNEDLFVIFEKGMEIAKNKSKHINNFPRYSRLHNLQSSKELCKIEQIAEKLNASILSSIETQFAEKVEQVLKQYDRERFKNILLNDQAKEVGFFHLIDPHLFHNTYVKLSNLEKREIYNIMSEFKVKYNAYNACFRNEINFYLSVKNLLDDNSETQISKINCNWLSTLFKNIVEDIKIFTPEYS